MARRTRTKRTRRNSRRTRARKNSRGNSRRTRTRKNSRRTRRTRGRKNTRKSHHPAAGWGKHKPITRGERRSSKKRCGRGCFLEPSLLKFPVCPKGSCKPSCQGLMAAYMRARQWRGKYPRAAGKAISIAKRHGCPWSKRH